MNYNTGKVIVFEILQKDKINSAREIAEGSASLEKLLLLCFDNNIRTISCCSHECYIAFEVTDNNLDFHMKLKKVLMDNYGLEIIYDLNGSEDKVTYAVYGDNESIFENLYRGISMVLHNKQEPVSYCDIEFAYALLKKVKNIYINLPNENNEHFYIQSDRKIELDEFLLSDDYYGKNLYIMDRTDIQNKLYSYYHDGELINEKKGFLSRMLGSVFLNKKSK